MDKRLKGLSLFANVGIAEAYLEQVGIDICVANEIDVDRARFYQEVYPKTHMICGDITDDKIRTKIVEESQEKNVEFIIATPPCQGMSEAGKRLEFDPRNQLIFYAIDVIKRLKPKFVLLENVPQQLKTKIKHNGEIMLIPDYIKKEALMHSRPFAMLLVLLRTITSCAEWLKSGFMLMSVQYRTFCLARSFGLMR